MNTTLTNQLQTLTSEKDSLQMQVVSQSNQMQTNVEKIKSQLADLEDIKRQFSLNKGENSKLQQQLQQLKSDHQEEKKRVEEEINALTVQRDKLLQLSISNRKEDSKT